MKRIFAGLFVFALTIGAAQAQAQTKDSTHRKHEKHSKGNMDRYERLNLTEDQKASMKTLREDFRKQNEALKNQASTLSAAQIQERRKALQDDFKAKSENILTKEQKEQLSQAKKGDKGGKGKKSGMKDHGERSRDLQKELNLTPDQQAKIAKLREDFRIKSEELRKNESLSKEERKKQFKQLHEENQNQMKQVLTKEQMEKIGSGREKRSDKK
jgi:Spy/CpxP family protein refolding chaperone